MKRIITIIIVGGCWGLLLLFVKNVFQISDDTFWQFYLIFGGVVIVGLPAFNLLYNLHYQKKMMAAAQLLEAGRAEEYITEVESLRRRAKGRFANNMLTINLSAGYSRLKQYDKAAELLESLSHEKLPGVFGVVYHINLCVCYFYQNQTDQALTLYESSQRVFHPYRNNKLYGGNIAILDIFAAIGHKEYARAAELLKTAQSTWDEPHFLEDYRYLEEKIQQSLGEITV